MATQPNNRAKRWCFTLNNYTVEEEHNIQQIDCEYLIYGHEVGENGTPHLQGYITFSTRKSFNTMKRLLGERAHIEVARGKVQDNIDYCTKQDHDHYFVKGEAPPETSEKGAEATKRKWEEARKAAKEGRFEDIPSDLWIRYRNSWKNEYQEEVNKNVVEIRDFNLKDHFYWIYGPTGTGKSHLARALAKKIDPDGQPYLKPLNKWWNGFRGQKVTLIEEATPDACKFIASLFKQWCDKWPFTAEVKGGAFENGIRPDYIIITSNYSIMECFPNEEDYLPMKRRCTEFHKEKRESWFEIQEPEHDTQQISPCTQDIPKLPRTESYEILVDSDTINSFTHP